MPETVQKTSDSENVRPTRRPANSCSAIHLLLCWPWRLCPWLVSTRRTWGGVANSKRWAVLFTYLGTRAIHIELVESMDSSSFINALLTMILSLAGNSGTVPFWLRYELRWSIQRTPSFTKRDGSQCHPVILGYRGLGLDLECSSLIPCRWSLGMDDWSDLSNPGCNACWNWTQASLSQVLSTLMAEVTTIMNARPLVPVPTDPEVPEILTPATLLTQIKLEAYCRKLQLRRPTE